MSVERKSSFLERVEVERTAIDAANSRLTTIPPLTGLSHGAIGYWKASVDRLCGRSVSNELVAMLERIAELGRIRFAVSDEYFDPVAPEEVKNALSDLDKILIRALEAAGNGSRG